MQAILLDTNVLSELMRPKPDAAVMGWFARYSGATFYVSVITQAEITLGISLLPEGKRRDALTAAAEGMFAQEFAGRCLVFDQPSAVLYGSVVSGRRRVGLGTSTEDALIAATALAHGYPIATRNVKDFSHVEGLELHNPWEG